MKSLHVSTPHLPHLFCMGVMALLLLVGVSSHAQDQHFSMLDLDPLLFNPAYSGFFDGTARFGAVYRNQWASVSTPFQTLSATAEFAIARSHRNMNGFSAGLWLTADRAGSLSYGNTAASAVISYFQGLGDGANIISIALEAGIGQLGFNDEGILLPDGTEPFQRTRTPYPTIGAGLAWFCQLSDVLYTKFGLSVRNINQPDISLTNVASDSHLSRHYNIYARAEWRITSQWGVLPLLGYQRQRAFNELVYGCDARFYVREQPDDYLAFGGGFVGRHGDAASIDLCMLWRQWTFAFCYDANLSRLSAASHTLGAFELGVVYMLSPRQPKRSSLPCPVF